MHFTGPRLTEKKTTIRMCRRILVTGGLLIAFATMAFAQDSPRIELFGGYSFLQANPVHTSTFTSNGWDASLVFNANRWLGVEANVSDHYGTSPGDIEGLGPTALAAPIPYATGLAFLFGPHLTYKNGSRLTPFVHALFGGAHGKGSNELIDVPCSPTIACGVTRSQTAFSMAFGGGVDWSVSRAVSIRIIQADYQRVNFTGNPQNNIMISAGIVFTLGRR